MRSMLSVAVATLALIGFAGGALAGPGCGSGEYADPGGRDGTVAQTSTHTTQTQIATDDKK